MTYELLVARLRTTALILTGTLAAAAECTPRGVVPQTEPVVAAAANPCKSFDDFVWHGEAASCSQAEQICLLASGVQEAIGQPTFIPAANFELDWKTRVKAWQVLLVSLSGAKEEEEELILAVHDLKDLIELANAAEPQVAEANRSAMIKHQKLQGRVQALLHAGKLKTKEGLSCK